MMKVFAYNSETACLRCDHDVMVHVSLGERLPPEVSLHCNCGGRVIDHDRVYTSKWESWIWDDEFKPF